MSESGRATPDRVRPPRIYFDLFTCAFVRLRDGEGRCAYSGERLGPVKDYYLRKLREKATRS